MASPITTEKLNELGPFILTGMSEKESCVMVGISYNELQKLKESNEEVREYIEKKMTKFKYYHLKEIQKDKSSKNSQWLLEKLVPEFGPKPKGGDGVTINIASQILKEIQNDNQPIINIRTVEAREESNENDQDPAKRIAEVLG